VIFKTQAPAPAGSLQVEVIGHQWWWEFRYPEHGITTANELYLPIGRTVNFAIRTNDVIHSFWIPQLGGKRDAVSNRTNYVWFTPDSVGEMAFNGTCNEYCGTSHANMRLRAFTVSPENFDKWVAHQKAPASFGVATVQPAAAIAPIAEPYSFPRDRVPDHVMPKTPVPAGLTFPENVLAAGDPQRGMQIYSRSACIGCHKVRGNPTSLGVTGPDLTHIASRLTIAAGLYPNDARHLALWIKNARRMKPMSSGLSMPTLGIGEADPFSKIKATANLGGLTDEQIADIVAYLMQLK
jgi:cytochrome c oxidase subunit 2